MDNQQLLDAAWQALTLAIVAIINAALPIFIAMAFKWAQTWVAEAKARLSREQRAVLDFAVTIAVQSAEQAGLADIILNEAHAKKEYAVRAARSYLEAYGVNLDVDLIAAAIERGLHLGLHQPDKFATLPEFAS